VVLEENPITGYTKIKEIIKNNIIFFFKFSTPSNNDIIIILDYKLIIINEKYDRILTFVMITYILMYK